MIRKVWSKRIGKVFLISLALIIAGTGTALAYFTLTSSGTGYVQDDPPPTFSVVLTAPTGGELAPGNGVIDSIGFTVTNSTSTDQTINGETWTLTTDSNGGIYDTLTNQFVDGCQASWFSVDGGDGGVQLPHTVTPGASLDNGGMTVTMPADPGVNQDACQGLDPQVSVSIS